MKNVATINNINMSYDNIKKWASNPLLPDEYTWKIEYDISPELAIKEKGRKKTVTILEVGDYSLLVKGRIKNVSSLWIRSRKSKWFCTKEIVHTPESSMLYFEENIKGVFKKGCIYPIVSKFYNFSYKTLEDTVKKLLTRTPLSLSKYLKQVNTLIWQL